MPERQTKITVGGSGVSLKPPMILCLSIVSIMAASANGYLETYPTVQQSNDTTPLYFGLIMSFPGGEFDSSGAIAGVRVALDRINNDTTVLPNHTLHYTLTNSSVSYIYIYIASLVTLSVK